MSFLKTMAIIFYSLAFAHAGTDMLTSPNGLSYDFIFLVTLLTLPLFSYLLMRVFTSYKAIIDSSYAITQDPSERKEENLSPGKIIPLKHEKLEQKTNDDSKNNAA